MGYNLNKDKIVLTKQRRIFFKRKNIASFAYPLMVLFGFIITIGLIAPAFAIETTKASALTLGEMREDYILSRTLKVPKNSPHTAQVDPCLSFLNARHSPDAKTSEYTQMSNNQHNAGTKAVPVALGFALGVRIALGPREVVSETERVKLVSEIRNQKSGHNSRALAIAAYRGCKNDQTLALQKNKTLEF